MKLITTTLCSLLLVSLSACDKKEDKKEPPKTDKKSEAKTGDKGEAKTPEPEKKPEPAAPKLELEPLAIADWGVTINVPKGTKAGEVDAGDAELGMPDNITLSAESACGWDIDLHRHWKKDLDSMYDNDKSGLENVKDLEFLKDEKTETGWTIHYKGKIPLGDAYGASTGLVVGDRLILCGASAIGHLEEKEAACVLAACTTLAESAKAEGDAKAGDAKAGDAKPD